MFTAWADFDRTFAILDQLRRHYDHELFGNSGAPLSSSWPRAALYDTGNELILDAELPGISQNSVNLSIHENVLTLSGERPARAMEGYGLHRQERGAMKFSRSFSLPTRVDTERTSAELKDGVLKVTLPKHAESKPRQINVR